MSVDLDPIFGCELATGRKDRDGYAYHGNSRAHIVAWEAVHGPRPLDVDGKPKPIDHLCRRRHCVAVHHLECVDKGENERRKLFRYRMRRAHCQHGHSMSDGLMTPEGGRVCRRCNRDALSTNESRRLATTRGG